MTPFAWGLLQLAGAIAVICGAASRYARRREQAAALAAELAGDLTSDAAVLKRVMDAQLGGGR